MIPLLAAALAADDPTAALEDALLARALGDYDMARSRLLTLAHTLPADEPVRGWSLYWLATLRLDWGEVDGARESLRDCVRSGPAREDCEDLLAQVELERAAMRAIPTVWSFDTDIHGLVLPGVGAMQRLGDSLRWSTPHDPATLGDLLFGVDLPPDAPPDTLALELTPLDRDAWLGVVFVDRRGGLFPAAFGVRRLGADARVRLVAPLRDARGPTGALDPRALDRVVIRNLTALNRDSGGESVVELHTVELR